MTKATITVEQVGDNFEVTSQTFVGPRFEETSGNETSLQSALDMGAAFVKNSAEKLTND